MRAAMLLPFVFVSMALAQSPQLMVTDKSGDKPHPIALAKADIHVLISGQLAQTTMTLVFSNDLDRVLEGELVFPLPENATVCGYALDVKGDLVDAVVVSKEKARVAFETEVRSGIDPGIIEKVQGNNFRTRVYPIPARGTRTIRVQYVSDLGGDANGAIYALPLKWSSTMKEGSIKLEVIKAATSPKIQAKGLDDLAFSKWEDRFVCEQKLAGKVLDTTLSITLPPAQAGAFVVEKRTRRPVAAENLDPKFIEQFSKTDFFFVINDTLPLIVQQPKARQGPVLVVWDASLSRANVDHAREFALIERHVKSGADLIVVRNTAETPVSFDSAAKLVAHLKTIPYDGGTNMGAVILHRNPAKYYPNIRFDQAPPDYSMAMLFSDGLSNLGGGLPAKTDLPIYTISNDPRANHTLLRFIAGTSDGAYINLDAAKDAQADELLSASPITLMSVEHDDKQITEIFPRLPARVGRRMTLTGKLLAPSAKITLNYGVGGAVTHRVPITLTQDGAAESAVASRYWAQMKVNDLSVHGNKFATDITAIGKEFNLVTDHTSMIVLETVEQYLRHQIVPPKSRKAVYDEFLRQIELNRGLAQKVEQAKIDRVVSMWKARNDWFDKEYKYPADFKFVEELRSKQGPVIAGVAVEQTNVTAATGRPESPRPAAVNSPEPRNGQPMDPAARPASGENRDGGGARDQAPHDQRFLGNFGALASTVDRQKSMGGEGSELAKDGRGLATGRSNTPSIKIKPWSADAPHIKAILAAPADAYNIYVKERKSNESSPAYYLDCADAFIQLGQRDLAVRILTNIPEIALEDGRLLRIAAHRLMQIGELDSAIDLFEKVSVLRPEEPQSFRDLALALAGRGDAMTARQSPDRARSDYEQAITLLHKVVMNNWQRFEEIELIALMDANRIIAKTSKLMVANPFDARLVKLMDVDLRIIMTWDTDNTDIDLHVIEPSGETAFYSHNRTTIGGLVSRDFTQGYGPEEYVLRKLMPGTYTIKANFYGNGDQKLVGPTTVQATIITHFGKPDEKRQSITLRLKDAKDMVEIGRVDLQAN